MTDGLASVQQRPRYCVHCGDVVIPDDAGGWLHEGGNRSCGLTAHPEPLEA